MSSRDLRELTPQVQAMAVAMLAACKAQGLKVTVACTYRSPQEQNALYEQGRTVWGKIVTNARAGQSKHETRQAIDIYPLINGKLADEKTHEGMAAWQALGFIGKKVGFVWGGDWRMRDYPHFELKE